MSTSTSKGARYLRREHPHYWVVLRMGAERSFLMEQKAKVKALAKETEAGGGK